MASSTETINYDGALLIGDLARILRTSPATIKLRLDDGTFPIQPLRTKGIDRRVRFSGPVVRQWLADNGVAPTLDAALRRMGE